MKSAKEIMTEAMAPAQPQLTLGEWLQAKEGALWTAADTARVTQHIAKIEAVAVEIARRMRTTLEYLARVIAGEEV